MEISKQNLNQAIAALRQCSDENKNRITNTGHIRVSDLCNDVADYLEHPKPLWKDAQGDDLPPIDKEVIVLCDDNFGGYKVCFGHRPNPQGYYGKNLTTGEDVRKYRYEVQTYDKGGWNVPDIKYWLDVELPNLEDLK